MGYFTKFLKPYRWLILLSIICLICTSMASLFLPDRMSKIIGEGITTEVVFEEVDGRQVHISYGDVDMPLPKLVYSDDAGILVTEEIDGKLYVPIPFEVDSGGNPIMIDDGNGNLVPVMLTEKTADGQPVSYYYALAGLFIPIPRFLRTSDGTATGTVQQGTLLLDEAGSPKIQMAQKSNMSIIWKNGLIMLAITLISSILSIVIAFLSSKVGCGFGRDVRKSLFSKVLTLSQSQEESFTTASLITRTTNDVTQLQMLLIMALRMAVNVPFVFIGALVMALNKDKQMTLVLLVTIPIVAVTIALVAKIVIPIFKSMQKRIDRLTLVSREFITGIRVIRAFGGEEHESKRFDDANKSITSASLKSARIISILMPLMTLVMSLTTISIIFIAAYSIDGGLKRGELDFTRLGNMMAVIQYIMQIMMSVVMLSMVFIMVPRASVSATRIKDVLMTEPDITDTDTPETPERKGLVQFDNVSFSFSDSSKKVLDNISFSAKKGTVTAIIGGTGSGKTTLMNLIPRQYDVKEGAVKVDGADVKNLSLNDLRSRIGFVTQKAVLFAGDIKGNILYGQENEDMLEKAAKIAQAEDFIAEKDGYDAIVEQGGGNFSGGQKQRLSIARAIAKDADILIFDDSFSALDYTTDAKLRRELKTIINDKTVLIVAQRIGTVMDADNILVMDKGRLVGEGKHETLLRSCPEYREIALSQLSEDELGLTGGSY